MDPIETQTMHLAALCRLLHESGAPGHEGLRACFTWKVDEDGDWWISALAERRAGGAWGEIDLRHDLGIVTTREVKGLRESLEAQTGRGFRSVLIELDPDGTATSRFDYEMPETPDSMFN